MKKKYLLGFLITAIILSTGILQADEFCNLELVDVWKCPYIDGVSISNSGLAYHDGYLYFPGRDHIYILEPSDSGTLTLNSTQVDTDDNYIGDIVVRNNLAYVSNAYNLLVYDVSNPLVFDSLGSCAITVINQIFLLDTLLIAFSSDIDVINISDSTNPTYVRGYSMPWTTHYLPVVELENYPYVLVPCLMDYSTMPDSFAAYINVIDITETYSYSPHLNIVTDGYNNYLRSLIKINDYYIGATDYPHLTFYEMDTAFTWTEPKTTYTNYPDLSNTAYLQAINDTIIFTSKGNGINLVNIADTSSLATIASYENTDGILEYFYDIVVQDSFLYVFTSLFVGDGRNDTMCVYSFKMDMTFPDQCQIQSKPEQFEFEVYPNPFNSECTIKYSMRNRNEEVNLEIYNIEGKIIDMYSGLPGNNSLKWNASDNPSGVYIIKASNNEESFLKKIIYLG